VPPFASVPPFALCGISRGLASGAVRDFALLGIPRRSEVASFGSSRRYAS